MWFFSAFKNLFWEDDGVSAQYPHPPQLTTVHCHGALGPKCCTNPATSLYMSGEDVILGVCGVLLIRNIYVTKHLVCWNMDATWKKDKFLKSIDQFYFKFCPSLHLHPCSLPFLPPLTHWPLYPPYVKFMHFAGNKAVIWHEMMQNFITLSCYY